MSPYFLPLLHLLGGVQPRGTLIAVARPDSLILRAHNRCQGCVLDGISCAAAEERGRWPGPRPLRRPPLQDHRRVPARTTRRPTTAGSPHPWRCPPRHRGRRTWSRCRTKTSASQQVGPKQHTLAAICPDLLSSMSRRRLQKIPHRASIAAATTASSPSRLPLPPAPKRTAAGPPRWLPRRGAFLRHELGPQEARAQAAEVEGAFVLKELRQVAANGGGERTAAAAAAGGPAEQQQGRPAGKGRSSSRAGWQGKGEAARGGSAFQKIPACVLFGFVPGGQLVPSQPAVRQLPCPAGSARSPFLPDARLALPRRRRAQPLYPRCPDRLVPPAVRTALVVLNAILDPTAAPILGLERTAGAAGMQQFP